MKTFHQCLLRRGETETVGWIEARGARVGAEVQILPAGDFWKVIQVYDHSLPEDVLKEHQRLHRKSLPSVEGMGP